MVDLESKSRQLSFPNIRLKRLLSGTRVNFTEVVVGGVCVVVGSLLNG